MGFERHVDMTDEVSVELIKSEPQEELCPVCGSETKPDSEPQMLRCIRSECGFQFLNSTKLLI